MSTKEMFQIVLGKVVEEMVPAGAWAADLGRGPKLKPIKRATALMWKSDSTEKDVYAAEVFCGLNDLDLFRIPADEPDPIGRVKQMLLGAKQE